MIVIYASNGVAVASGNDYKEVLHELVDHLNRVDGEESDFIQKTIENEFLDIVIDG